MPPRPRKRGSKDLPHNLYQKKTPRGIYFQYKHPVTGEYTGFGYNKQQAVQAAKQLNQLLIQETDLISKVLGGGETFGQYLEYFRDDIIPFKRVNGKPLSDNTLREYKRVIKVLIAELGHHSLDTISQSDIAEYLSSRSTSEVYNKHRTMLVMVFRQAVSDQKVMHNLAERVIKRDADETKRAPLTLEMYQRIYEHARPAIRNAMELSLNILQRRGDIQRLRFDSKIDNHYRIIISKTKKHGKDAYIEIPADLPVAFSAAGAKKLEDLVRNCRDEFVCPFMVHEPPQRRKESKEKEHSMQLSPGQISKGFAEAREAAGIKMDNPPTFHELLALGQALREQQGWELKDIKKLRGHRKESTTKRYQERQIQWVRIEVPKAAQ
jgi:hypothetical protein